MVAAKISEKVILVFTQKYIYKKQGNYYCKIQSVLKVQCFALPFSQGKATWRVKTLMSVVIGKLRDI